MTDVCDSDADIENLRKTIKMQTGQDVKLTRKQMCDAYNNIHGGKLPLPPLVMTSDRTYLVDRASPLKHLEYELLFDSTTKRVDLKKIARKVGLTSQIEQMTKKQLVDAIGKRLRYLKVREPIKIVSKRLIAKTVPKSTNNTAVNNTAVNNTAVNNTAVNNTAANNTAVNNNRRNFNNNSAFNNTENRGSNFNNFGSNNNKNENGGNKNNSVKLSGNVNGLKFNKNNNNNSQTSFKFPNKLSFNGSFGSSNKKNSNSGTQTNAGTGTNSGPPPTQFQQKPAFLTSTSTGTNSGPPPTQFGNGFKTKPAFMNKIANKTTNGPKKPGMFNWMFKKKGAAAAGAAGVAAGATTANGPKKCGMMNRMMGKCKDNGTVTNNGPKNNGTVTNNGPKNNGTVTNNGPKNNVTAVNNGPKNNGTSRDVTVVANKLITEINKDVVKELRNNTTNNGVVVKSVTNGIVNQIVKRDMTNSIKKRVNTTNSNNKSLTRNVTNDVMNEIIKDVTNDINRNNNVKTNKKVTANADIKFVANKIYNEMSVDVTNKVKSGIRSPGFWSIIKKSRVSEPKKVNTNNKAKIDADIKFVADKIYNKMSEDVNKKVRNGIRLGGRASESRKPVYNNNSNSNNNNNKTKTSNNNKKNLTMVNNPTFNSNNKNNFKNASNNVFKINNNNNGEISAESLTKSINVNNIPKEVERQENDVRNMIKNLNSEKDKLKNKITKELNLRPNDNGVFKEREGITKGKIGVWAKELRKADTIENLKSIENKLNEKTILRKDIENKYTKMGLTKVEKMNHRRKVVKFVNNVDERRKLVEIQVKNKKNNNNNTNSVVSNYNSDANANSNEPKKKMKYGSRDNFINAKKVELRELAKNTSTNFGRNIDRMKNRTNVTKLHGRIEGAVLRDEALKKVNTRPRSERRVDNRAVLKNLKKKVKKNNPRFSPAKVNAEARRLRDLSRK